ncbi:hypothetical protein FEM48_Zijuj08G0105600 [Ziziphus jujuba var. spinosa]|uniref:TF-B3 domain-containing protein n=1 Tax=Ziziphus jujuba var. spinosa TaxID=714518 RepID=A0A978UYL2_ZIZJJ|nr:hypothetical protein FEM48_Zijuj08G0105600 [Ziziphus jujuba var. spinosa]
MAAKRKGCLGNIGPSSGRMRGSNISPPVHFFKVILRSTIDDQKLKLPKKFGREFGNDLSAVATITVPNGRTWQLGLQKTEEGRVLFADCWQEFVEYLSIDSGYFLIFGYKGFSKFNVC